MTTAWRDRVLPLGFYGGVVLAAWLFNRGDGWAGSLFVLGCLGLPWLGEPHSTALADALRVRRSGWGLAAGAAAAFVLGAGVLLALSGVVVSAAPDYLRSHPGQVGQQIAVLAILALAEEFFFRGYLQGTVGMRAWGAQHWGGLTAANLAAALLFGAAHLVDRPPAAIPLLVLGGMCLGWLFERSQRSIWPAVLLHLVANLVLG